MPVQKRPATVLMMTLAGGVLKQQTAVDSLGSNHMVGSGKRGQDLVSRNYVEIWPKAEVAKHPKDPSSSIHHSYL